MFNIGGCCFLFSLCDLEFLCLNLNEWGLCELLDNWKFFLELRYLYLFGNLLGDEYMVYFMVKKVLFWVYVFIDNVKFIY